MKLKLQIIAVTMGVLLAGCGKNEQPQNATNPDKPVSANDVKDRVKDAATATKEYAAESKDEFVAAMGNKLTDMDARIDELAKKSETYKDEAKAQADKALADLRAQRDKAKQQFEEAKKASAEAWNDVKTGFAAVMDELEKTYENVKSKFN